MRNVHDQEPVLFQTRWALTYLRGPMTLQQIAKLSFEASALEEQIRLPMGKAAFSGNAGAMQLSKDAGSQGNVSSVTVLENVVSSVAATGTAFKRMAKPMVAPELPEMFLKPSGWMDAKKLVYRPKVLGVCRLHFVQASARMDLWQTRTLTAPLALDGSDGLWRDAVVVIDGSELAEDHAPMEDVPFAELPAAVSNPKVIRLWGRSLESFIYQDMTLNLMSCPDYKLFSEPGEKEGDFRARVSLIARENRDAEIDRLKEKYEAQLMRLQEKHRMTAHRLEQRKDQISQQKLHTALSVGTTILGALFGRKAASIGTLSRASTAMRSAGRISSKKEDVSHAEETLQGIQQQMVELDAEFTRERDSLHARLVEPHFETIPVRPRKSDITVIKLALAWMPEKIA